MCRCIDCKNFSGSTARANADKISDRDEMMNDIDSVCSDMNTKSTSHEATDILLQSDNNIAQNILSSNQESNKDLSYINFGRQLTDDNISKVSYQ